MKFLYIWIVGYIYAQTLQTMSQGCCMSNIRICSAQVNYKIKAKMFTLNRPFFSAQHSGLFSCIFVPNSMQVDFLVYKLYSGDTRSQWPDIDMRHLALS